jgi:hypothetical protein
MPSGRSGHVLLPAIAVLLSAMVALLEQQLGHPVL